MNDSIQAELWQLSAHAAETALLRLNDMTDRYGLRLTQGQIIALVAARKEALAQTGRVELGEGVLPKLVYAFADSPYIQRDTYAQTLGALQELFYTFKNECEDALTDDELVEAMQTLYNRKAHGSLEYLENVTMAQLYRALRPPTIGGDDGDNGDEEAEWID